MVTWVAVGVLGVAGGQGHSLMMGILVTRMVRRESSRPGPEGQAGGCWGPHPELPGVSCRYPASGKLGGSCRDTDLSLGEAHPVPHHIPGWPVTPSGLGFHPHPGLLHGGVALEQW